MISTTSSPVDHHDQRLLHRDRGEQRADAADDELLPVVRVVVVAVPHLAIRRQLREPRDHRVRSVALGRAAAGARDELCDLLERLFARGSDRVAHELRGRAERHLLSHGRALDADQARVRRKLRDERRHQRRLPDAELPHDRARRHHAAAAASVHRFVVRGVEVRLLRVAPHEIARGAGDVGQLLLARQTPFEGIDAHRRRHVEPGARFERQRRRVAPSELATHEPVHAAGDPGAMQRRRLGERIGEVACRVVQPVPNEVPLRVAPPRSDAAHDPDRRAHWRRKVIGHSGDGLVNVERQARRVRRRASRVGRQSGDGPRVDRGRPRPARVALVRDLVEHVPQVLERALGDGAFDDAVEVQGHDRNVPHFARPDRRGSLRARRRRVSRDPGAVRAKDADHFARRAARRRNGRDCPEVRVPVVLLRWRHARARPRRLARHELHDRVLQRLRVDQLLLRQERPRDRRL
jgi:hypothetical protein